MDTECSDWNVKIPLKVKHNVHQINYAWLVSQTMFGRKINPLFTYRMNHSCDCFRLRFSTENSHYCITLQNYVTAHWQCLMSIPNCNSDKASPFQR